MTFSVAELAVIYGPAYHSDYAIAIVANVGAGNFVAAGTDNTKGSVTEFDGATDALVRVIHGPKYRVDEPVALAS